MVLFVRLLHIFIWNPFFFYFFFGPPKSLGPGLLSLCMKTALYARLEGMRVLLSIAHVCVLTYAIRSCVSAFQCQLLLCECITYGVVGVVQSTEFVCVRVRVTDLRAIQFMRSSFGNCAKASVYVVSTKFISYFGTLFIF